MEPELLQAFTALSKQLDDIKADIKDIKGQNKEDHDKLIEVNARQQEIIRDVDSIGEKVRLQGAQIWKIYAWATGIGVASGSGVGLVF